MPTSVSYESVAFLTPSHDVGIMRVRFVRWLVSMLVVLAFVGGTTVQAMPLNAGPVEAMQGCVEMAMTLDAGGAAPSKGMTPDCVKSMQCLCIPDSPTRTSMIQAPVSY